MLRVATILSLLLLNVSIISCFPTVYQDANAIKKASEDEVLFSPDSTDKEPDSEIRVLPSLEVLGVFNNKVWSIGRTSVQYQKAVSDCEALGLRLAEADQAELNFLYTVTASSDDYAWLGATNVEQTLSSFRWAVDGSTPTNVPFRVSNGATRLALGLDRFASNSGLRSDSVGSYHYYICVY